MDYISSQEAADKWGVSLRYVQKLAQDHRIPGARKYGVSWFIPMNAEKPDDPRSVRKQSDNTEAEGLPLIPVVLSKRNPDDVKHSFSAQHRLLFEADMAYRRGDSMPAIRIWKRTPDGDSTELAAASIATAAAISVGDFDLYQAIQQKMDNRMAKAKNDAERALLGLPLAMAAVSMSAVSMTPQWLKGGDFSLFPREYTPYLLYFYTLHLRNMNDMKAVLYTARTSYELCAQTNTFTWLDIYNLILCAQACFDLGDRERAREYLLTAMRLGLPAGFIAPFADYLGMLGGLVETCLDMGYPQYQEPIAALWNRSFKNWMTFHNRFTCENITVILTPQEYQLARLIAHGASYAEAAQQMCLSVGRVKNVLMDVYGKLYINKRGQLSQFVT